MAATVAVKKRTKVNGLFAVIADVTFDDSYPEGGEAITANQLGLNTLDLVMVAPAGGYIMEFDHTNKKIKAYAPVNAVAGDGVADANNTLMKSATGTVEVAGTGTAFQVAAAEVAATTDLHTVTTRIMAYGL